MKHISSFDEAYPVKTFFTDRDDCRPDSGWNDAGTRNGILAAALRVPVDRVFYARETHSGSVFAVTKEHPDGRIALSEESLHLGSAGGYDALVTDMPGILLCIWTADCLPLYLYDPERQLAAIAHCGWRGICENIVGNTVEVMKRLGGESKQMLAAFGPCICGKCYEVSEDLRLRYREIFSAEEIKELFVPRQNGKYVFDLRGAAAMKLLQSGVSRDRIHDTGLCSYESAQYASYRRDGSSEPFRQTLSGIVLG